jgi:hypothetical protein
VFRVVLGIAHQVAGPGLIRRPGSARARALDRLGDNLAAGIDVQEPLGRIADQRAPDIGVRQPQGVRGGGFGLQPDEQRQPRWSV